MLLLLSGSSSISIPYLVSVFLLSTGSFSIETSSFWTLPHDFAAMREESAKLYVRLAKSDLIIFKGGLVHTCECQDLSDMHSPISNECSTQLLGHAIGGGGGGGGGEGRGGEREGEGGE